MTETVKMHGQSNVSNLTASFLTLGVTSAISSFAAFLLFELALASPVAMIQFGLGGLILASSSLACVMIITGPDIIGALFWSVVTAFIICFVINMQDRVAFAAANLGTAAAAIKKHRQTLSVAGGTLFMQLLWLSVWMVAVLGVGLRNHRVRQESMPPSSYAYSSFAQNALQHQYSGIGKDIIDVFEQNNSSFPLAPAPSPVIVPDSAIEVNSTTFSYSFDDDDSVVDDMLTSVSGDDAFYFPPNNDPYSSDKHHHKHDDDHHDDDGYDDDYNDDGDGHGDDKHDDNRHKHKHDDDHNDEGNELDDHDDVSLLPQSQDQDAYGDDQYTRKDGDDATRKKKKKKKNKKDKNKDEQQHNKDKNNEEGNNFEAGDPSDTSKPDTASPVPAPTAVPLSAPTAAPIPAPTAVPLSAPTAAPIPAPTSVPVSVPTMAPVPNPTMSPIPIPEESDKDEKAEKADEDDHPESGVAGLFQLRKLGYTKYGDDSAHLPVDMGDDHYPRPVHKHGDDHYNMKNETGEGEDGHYEPDAPPDDVVLSDGDIDGYAGDDALGEFFGLGPGCKTVIVDYKSSARLNLYLENGTIEVYCACASGQRVTIGRCDTVDFARTELKNGCWMYFLLALSLYWGGQVLAGIVHVTASGTVGAWWFGAAAYNQKGSAKFAYSQLKDQEKGEGDITNANVINEGGTAASSSSSTPMTATERRLALSNATTEKVKQNMKAMDQTLQNELDAQGVPITDNATTVVNASLNRALGPSFGSICFGALFVAFFATCETIVRYIRKSCFKRNDDQPNNGGICCVCVFCLDAASRCLREVTEYFNRWAFTYVAIYGDGFMRAGRNACALFRRRGWNNVLTDTLCATALKFASITIAVFVGIVAYFIATLFDALAMRSLLVGASVVIAYMICTCVTSVLDAAVLAILICFAEDPNPCSQNHPDEFKYLVDAWSKIYEPELKVAGYDRFF